MPFTIYDLKTGAPVQVEVDQLQEAFATGKYGMPQGEETLAIDPSGKAVRIPSSPDNLLNAIDEGFKIESPEMTKERHLQRDYTDADNVATSTISGALDTASFGLSKVMQKQLPPSVQEYIRKSEDASPTANTAGRIGGGIIPFLVPGGQGQAASTLGKIVGGAGSGVRAANKVGLAAEKYVLENLARGGKEAGAIKSILSKGVGVGAGGAVEGALYGVGQTISEVAEGDIEPTAENLVANVGVNSVFGGIAGGVLGSSTQLVKKTLGTGKAFSNKSASSIVDMFQKGTGIPPVEGLKDAVELGISDPKALAENLMKITQGGPVKPGWYSRIWGSLTGKDPSEIQQYLGKSAWAKENRRLATEGEQILDQRAIKLANLNDEARALFDENMDQFTGKPKKLYITKASKDGDHVEAARFAESHLGEYVTPGKAYKSPGIKEPYRKPYETPGLETPGKLDYDTPGISEPGRPGYKRPGISEVDDLGQGVPAGKRAAYEAPGIGTVEKPGYQSPTIDSIDDILPVAERSPYTTPGMEEIRIKPGKQPSKKYVGVDGALGDVEKMMSDKHANMFGGQAVLKDLHKTLIASKKELKKILLGPQNKVAGGTFGLLDDIKRAYGNAYKRQQRVFVGLDGGKPHDENTLIWLERQFMKLRDELENEAVFGKAAANMQRETNRAWVEFFKFAKAQRAYRLDRFMAEADFGKVKPGKSKVHKSDPYGYRQMLGDAGTTKAMLDKEITEGYWRTTQNLLEKGAFYTQGSKKVFANLKRYQQIAKQVDDIFLTNEKQVGLVNQLAQISAKSNSIIGNLGIGGAGVGGFLVGGPVGAMVGVALSVFSNPGNRTTITAAFERLTKEVDINIGKGISRYMKKASGKLPRGKVRQVIVPTTSVLQLSNWGDKKTTDKNKRQALQRRSKELSEFINNPEIATDRLAQNTRAVYDVNPVLGQAVQTKAMQVAQFIYAKLPKTDKEGLFATAVKVSDVDIERTERTIFAATNPVEALANGNWNREIIKAIKELYPTIYEKFAIGIAERIPELRGKLPYFERVKLSILFDTPVEETMEPGFIKEMQLIAQAENLPQQPQGPGGKKKKPRKPSYSKLKTDNLKTEDQKVSETQA